MRTRAKQKIVAKATAPGARVPRAELFIHSGERPDLSAVLRKGEEKMGIYEELQARGLIAQVTDEEEIRELVITGKRYSYRI